MPDTTVNGAVHDDNPRSLLSGEAGGSDPVPGPLRLNLGAGGKPIEGYTSVDIKTGTDVRDLSRYADNSVDEIYASHVLEHVPMTDCDATLAEWARVLKPGGKIRIGVPDLHKLFKDWDDFTRYNFKRIIYGGHMDEDDRHHNGFDADLLRMAMNKAGIGCVNKFEPFHDDFTKHPYSLNLEGTKRWWPKIKNPKVCIILSRPRIVFSFFERQLRDLVRALPELGEQEANGAFWERDITLATHKCVYGSEADFLLYLDYDGGFSVNDVLALIEMLNISPQAAAVGGVQMSRHENGPLCFDPKLDYSGPVTRVEFLHFACTVIRAAVFPELPQPWWVSIPGFASDQNGQMEPRWDGYPRSDGDITFWRNMHEYGFEVYQANQIVIGHMVECMKWPSKKGFMFQTIRDYEMFGKPKNAEFDADVFRQAMLEKAKADKTAQEKPQVPTENA